MRQAYISVKPIKTRKREYRIGDKIETSNEDVIKTLIEQEAIISLRQAFENEYESFSRWLRRYPLSYLDLKEHKSDTYDAFMEMNRTIDKLRLQEDYKGFREAIELYKKEHLRIVLEGNAGDDRGRNREHYFESHF